MYILQEQEAGKDIARLDEAWSRNDTFVFLPAKCGISQEWISEQLSKIPEPLHTDHFILLTSGSTGLPKLVIGSRKRAETLVKLLHQIQDSEAVKNALVVLPLTYCYAFINQWLWARQYKRKITLTRGFIDPDFMQKCLRDTTAGLLCLVGAQIPMFAAHFPGGVFPGVIRLHFAGGYFPQGDLPAVRRLFPNASIFNNYGCAEAMPRLTIRRAEESDVCCNIGKPLPGIVLKSSEQGELLFKSPYSVVGYLDQEGYYAITKDTWVATGDLGSQITDGSWFLTGRTSEVFKRYGEKIALPYLMDTVKTVWDGQIAFYREIDPNGEPGHVLVLSPAPNADQLGRLMRAFRDYHSHVQWPLRIESAPEIPLLANGKPDIYGLSKITDKIIQSQAKDTVTLNREKLKALILDVFLLDSSEFHFNLMRMNVETWDSFGIVALAAGIKNVFGCRLVPAEVVNLKGIQDIIALLGKKGISFDE